MVMLVIVQAKPDSRGWIEAYFAIDRPLDMCRTVVNVTSDSTIAIVAKSVGNLKL
jgi:Na+/H+-dicarboxylate symporter